MIYQHELINSMLKMITVLFFLIGGLWAASLYLKKRYRLSRSFNENKKIKVLENCYIGFKKAVCLIQVPGEIIVLAISGEHITFLTKISTSNINELWDTADKKTKG
jgi:flagellar protein FliO/FliZ